MSLVDTIDQIWTQVLDVLAKVVSPDWGSLIGLLPLFLLIGVIGPGNHPPLADLGSIYSLRKPRTKIHFVEGPRPALIAADGLPLFPVGEPYDPRVRPDLPRRQRRGRSRQSVVGHLPDVRGRPPGQRDRPAPTGASCSRSIRGSRFDLATVRPPAGGAAAA